MELEEAIVAHLAANVEVVALIGGRTYPNTIPQDATLPAIAYQRISAPRILAHDGPTGAATARIQFTTTADTYAAARGVVKALRQALDGFTGWMGSAPGVRVFRTHFANENDGFGFEAREITIRCDYELVYLEAVR